MSESLFQEGTDKISYFYLECKTCRERWFSTFCICPRCRKVTKFKILSEEEADNYRMEKFFENQIHFVMMRGGM